MPPASDDLLLKQAVAVIDSRTTVICLHVNGQIQPVDAPFDTLVGEYDYPPFHLHCRTMVMPWVSGMVNDLRARANAELLTRPLKQRRIGPGGEIGGRLPPPPRDPAPTLGSTLDRPTEAAQRSSMPSGTARIDHVPSAQVRDWIVAHPERFEVTGNGGGISETYWVHDKSSARRYVLKKGQYHAESVNEVVSTRIANEIGLPGAAKIAGVDDFGNGWVLLEHAEDVMPGYKVTGTAGGHAQMVKLADRLEDPSDAVRAVLADFVTDEADAKGGNTLLLSNDGGKTVRIVPIDRSLSLMGWREAVEPGKTSLVAGDWSLEGRSKISDLRDYMKTRGSPKGLLDLVQTLAEKPGGKQMIRDTYDEVLTSLEAVDIDEMLHGFDRPQAHLAEIKSLVQRRIDLLRRSRDTILRQMGAAD